MAFEIVVFGASAGGLHALQTLLAALPADFPLPIVIVQHRGKDSEPNLCDYLVAHTGLTVREPEDKEEIRAGHVYLAPRDYHLLIEKKSFALSTDSPVCFARPSIDVLFESAAEEYREKTVGVILTGRNRDGARGLAKIKSCGGLTMVEDPISAASREMPQAAIDTSQVDRVVPLAGIAPVLEELSSSLVANYGS